MFTDSEAQRVIAISLGKIANCRNQRVGNSLHKNLLVANVLQKVRTFVSEDERPFQWETQFRRRDRFSERMVFDHNTQVLTDLNEHLVPEPGEDSSNLSPKPVIIVPSVNHGIGCDPTCDMVSSGNVSDTSLTQNLDPVDSKTFRQLAHDNNSLDSTTDNSLLNSQYPAGCLKRRRTTDCDISRAKRRKSESSTDDDDEDTCSWRSSTGNFDSESDNEIDILDLDQDQSASSQGESNMDVEQICNLVNVFKCSFKGLGIIESSMDDTFLVNSKISKHYSISGVYTQELSNQSSEVSPSLRRGCSLPDLCAKQADFLYQKFQQNSTVLTLAV